MYAANIDKEVKEFLRRNKDNIGEIINFSTSCSGKSTWSKIHPGGSFDLWRKIAAQDASFGNPDKFCMDREDSNWVSAAVNTLDDGKIIDYLSCPVLNIVHMSYPFKHICYF